MQTDLNLVRGLCTRNRGHLLCNKLFVVIEEMAAKICATVMKDHCNKLCGIVRHLVDV